VLDRPQHFIVVSGATCHAGSIRAEALSYSVAWYACTLCLKTKN
jgi:hypothetical protein